MIRTPLDRSTSPRRRVLLVDDDYLVRRALARVLRREFDVVTAVNAADAFAKITPDLHAVITDHHLGAGKATGRAVLDETRRRVPQALRILISGERQQMGSTEATLWHAMLIKPVARSELLAALSGLRSR